MPLYCSVPLADTPRTGPASVATTRPCAGRPWLLDAASAGGVTAAEAPSAPRVRASAPMRAIALLGRENKRIGISLFLAAVRHLICDACGGCPGGETSAGEVAESEGPPFPDFGVCP